MTTDDVRNLYTRRAGAYVAFVSAFLHRQGLREVLGATAAISTDQRFLDAGCGTGLSIRALIEVLQRRGYDYECIDGFDLTSAMLDRCRREVDRAGIAGVRLRQADVLHLDDQLPLSWSGYDVILCVSMLEYVPRPLLSVVLAALRGRLAPGGRLIVVITRRQMLLTRWLWHCEGYSRRELTEVFASGGFADINSVWYPWRYGWLNLHNHVVDAGVGLHPEESSSGR